MSEIHQRLDLYYGLVYVYDLLALQLLLSPRLNLYYGLVYIYDLLALQLLLSPSLQPIHEFKQVINGEVGNLKHKDGEHLKQAAYIPCLLQLPKFVSCLV